MSQDAWFMNLIVIVWIYAAMFVNSTGFFLCNPANPVRYEQDEVCCNGTLQSTLDIQGRTRNCCATLLFYPDKCRCDANSKLTSLNPGYGPGLCLVTDGEPSRTDPTETTPSSFKVPEIADITQNQRCLNPGHTYCNSSGNCYDPSEELCCPNGVFKGILLCPTQDSNRKFCTDNEHFGTTVCSEIYKYVYEVSVGEMIVREGSFKTFVARLRQIVPKGFRMRRRLSWKKFRRLKINVTTPYDCAITGRSFTAFSTKEHRWNTTLYIYLDKDDIVLSGKIRKKHLTTVYKNCNKPMPRHPFEAKHISNSGCRQYFTVLIICFIVHGTLKTLHCS